MDLTQVKEFVAESQEEAIAKAASHFGVAESELFVHVVPVSANVAGLGGRTIVLGSVRKAKEETKIGPIGQFVLGVLQRMKLTGRGTVSERRAEDGEIVVVVTGQHLQRLSNEDPRLMGALSHLAQRAAEKTGGEDARARVELVEEEEPRGSSRTSASGRGDRDRGRDRGRGRDRDRGQGRDRGRDRDRSPRSERGDRPEGPEVEEFTRLAREVAERVRQEGRDELLPPMTSRERWLIHNALMDEPGVTSESEGEGASKRVRVRPA